MSKIDNYQYLIPRPVPPWRDWRTYSMILPILSGTAGACIFMAIGFMFTQMAALSNQQGLVIFASFAVAFGSTFGSVGSGIEIFRKRYTGEVQLWDWISLGISTCTTVAGFAMGFAALLGATTDWSRLAQVYGSIVVGTLAALDSSGDMIELGGLFGSFPIRDEQWFRDREDWYERRGIVPQVDRSGWKPANVSDFRRLLAGLNGDRPKLTKDNLQEYFDPMHKVVPSQTTVDRWWREELEVH